jgi:hypothetical protein
MKKLLVLAEELQLQYFSSNLPMIIYIYSPP